MSKSVAIIGGGITGLATAALLASEGYSVDVLEQRDRVGGRAGEWSSAGFTFDTGPSWYLMPEVFEHFYEMLDTSSKEFFELVQLNPAYRVFHEGHAGKVDISASFAENQATFEAIEPGAGAVLAKYLATSTEAYDMAIKHFLYTSFDRPLNLLHPDILRRVGRLIPLLLKSLDSFTKSRFKDRRLQQILGYSAVFLGASPQKAPSMYHLMSSLDLTGGVLYPQGGFYRIISSIEQLALQAGARIHTSAEVTGVLTRPGTGRGHDKPAVSGVTYRQGGDSKTLSADVVVGAGDLHDLETRIIDEGLRTYPEKWWTNRLAGPGSVLAFLGVEGDVPELLHHTLFFSADWDANFGEIEAGKVPQKASVYVSRTSATDPSVAPPGHEAIVILVPVGSNPEIGHGGLNGGGSPQVEAAVDRAIQVIAAQTGMSDLAERIRVRKTLGPADFQDDLSAWRGNMLGPSHVLSQSAFFRGSNKSKKIEGLYYAGGNTIPGIGLPMCLISAELVLKRLRQDRSAGALPVPGRSPAGA